MNNQQREETSEIRKEENEIPPSYAGNDRIQSDDQSRAVQSYPSLAADASAQGDHISSTSTSTRTRSKSAVSHYKDAAADGVNEEQVDAENPAFPQTVVEIPSMHEQHGTPVRRNPTSKMSTSQDVKDFQNSVLFWIMQPKALLCKAALKGDWKAAEPILRVKEEFASLRITQNFDTLLHIAAGAKQTKFVRELVEFMSEDDLALTNDDQNTAFFIAAPSGVVEIAKVMYERNHELPTARGSYGMTPLYMAALLGNKDMVSYLHEVTRLENLEPPDRDSEYDLHFKAAINIEMFDLALNMWTEPERLAAFTVETKLSALKILARRPSVLTSFNQEWKWKRFLSIIRILQYIPWVKRIHDDIRNEMGAKDLFRKLLWELRPLSGPEILNRIIDTNILYDAAKEGNVKLLETLISECPELILRPNEDGHTIFHIAVLYRQEKVFNLIQDLGVYHYFVTLLKDIDKNNILHLAGGLAQESRLGVVSGAALQLQRELLWFKEVQEVVLPSFVEDKKYGDANTKRIVL